MEGGTLRTRLVERGAYKAATAVGVVASCLEGLEVCHQQGIVHRDLKPEKLE